MKTEFCTRCNTKRDVKMTSSSKVMTDLDGERKVIMTGITNITARVDSGMLVLTGECSRCSGDVARVIEND